MTSDEQTEDILGYAVYASPPAACADEIAAWTTGGDAPRWLACLNPHSYVVALGRPRFAGALKHADWLVPDGVGVVQASWFLGGRIRERITGSDVFRAVHDRLQARGGGSVFFLGSTEETLAQIREKMAADWPGLTIAGTYSPPFRAEFSDDEIDDMVAAINAVRPDVLWVGMTAPKQEEWVHRVIDRLDVRFAAAIGAVFDFYIGRVKRSHPVFQRLGLEWLPRLVQEPKRLWRRMFVSAPVFVWHVLLARVKNGI
ncbi:MAG: WecB/TagA/CpsF family glycosyltransferase [Anaerolineae bacterium]|nr:WecB/TagA/CpsF family glycosyltransferase [Anaerolineae bacterium]